MVSKRKAAARRFLYSPRTRSSQRSANLVVGEMTAPSETSDRQIIKCLTVCGLKPSLVYEAIAAEQLRALLISQPNNSCVSPSQAV